MAMNKMPFETKDSDEIICSVADGKHKDIPGFSEDFKHLLDGLFKTMPEDRLDIN